MLHYAPELSETADTFCLLSQTYIAMARVMAVQIDNGTHPATKQPLISHWLREELELQGRLEIGSAALQELHAELLSNFLNRSNCPIRRILKLYLRYIFLY